MIIIIIYFYNYDDDDDDDYDDVTDWLPVWMIDSVVCWTDCLID